MPFFQPRNRTLNPEISARYLNLTSNSSTTRDSIVYQHRLLVKIKIPINSYLGGGTCWLPELRQTSPAPNLFFFKAFLRLLSGSSAVSCYIILLYILSEWCVVNLIEIRIILGGTIIINILTGLRWGIMNECNVSNIFNSFEIWCWLDMINLLWN